MKEEKLENIFNINNGDIVSIVGSGGKTSLLFTLANKLKKNYRVLATTSTKIGKPSYDKCDYLYTNLKSYLGNKTSKNGVTVISKDIIKEKDKLIGLDNEDLDIIHKDFHIILLEADGSRRLPLKGWKSHEPCILDKTNKTIAIIPLDVIDKKVNKDFIYAFEEFNQITNNAQYVNEETIGKICSNQLGIFKNAKGKLYLYLNKADTKEDEEKAIRLAKYLKENIVGNPFEFKITFGSFEKGKFYEY